MTEEKLDKLLEISTDTRIRVAKIEERVQDIPVLWSQHRALEQRVDVIAENQRGIKVRLTIIAGALGAALTAAIAWLKSHLFGGS